MNAAQLANRLIRHLKVKNLAEVTIDGLQEIQDAINAALQKLHALAPPHSKIATIGVKIPAPTTFSIALSNGSRDITPGAIPTNFLNCTVIADGDDVDNRLPGNTVNSLLHPYQGTSGTKNVTIYGDRISIPSTISEIISEPMILETRTSIIFDSEKRVEISSGFFINGARKPVGRPTRWWSEPQAANQSSQSPLVMVLNHLPDRAYRITMDVVLAPARVAIDELLRPSADIPIRPEHVESFLLPLCKGNLADSSLWADPDAKSSARSAADKAEAEYSAIIPQTLSSFPNTVGTPFGY